MLEWIYAYFFSFNEIDKMKRVIISVIRDIMNVAINIVK